MKVFFRLSCLTGLFFVALSSLALRVHAVTADDAYQAGVAYYKQGQLDQCLDQMNAAVALNPSYWQAYQVLGYVYYREGNAQAALDAYDKSLQINPNNPQLQQIVDKLNSQDLPAPSMDNPQNNPASAYANPTPTMNSDSKIHNSFYFNLSGVTPDSPSGFTTGWTSGGSLGAAYGFGMNKVTSIVLSLQYSTFPLNIVDPGVTLSGGAFHTAMFLVNGKFILAGADNPVVFYLITGIGPAEFISDAITGTNNLTGKTVTETLTALSEMDFALRLGLGIDIKLGQGVYLNLETNGVETFVSQAVSTDGGLVNNMFSLGMRFDN